MLYLDIASMKLKDLREVCRVKTIALANPNIPTCCGYIGWDKKGRKKTQGKEIPLVRRDLKKGWGLLPVLVWVANENEELRLPEPEEVRKEVWGMLGAVASHANIAQNKCHILYEPKGDKEEGIDKGRTMPDWEMKETSPLKTKWRKYIPVETQPTLTTGKGKKPSYNIKRAGKYSGDRGRVRKEVFVGIEVSSSARGHGK